MVFRKMVQILGSPQILLVKAYRFLRNYGRFELGGKRLYPISLVLLNKILVADWMKKGHSSELFLVEMNGLIFLTVKSS